MIVEAVSTGLMIAKKKWGIKMSVQDNATIARSFYDAFNSRDFDRAAAFVAPDCEWLNVPTGEIDRGPAGFRRSMQTWVTAFPDATCEVTNMISAGDWVVAEFKGRGTHKGPLASPTGEIPPTGRWVELPFCELIQFRNGKVVAGRTYFDVASMLRQLGLMPAARQAGQ